LNRDRIHRGCEGGQAVLLVIVGISVLLIGALGLALDGAQMYAQQQMARSAADAAAQAGMMSIYRGTNITASSPFGTGSTPAAFTCSTSDARTPCVYARLNGFGRTASDIVIVSFPTSVAGVSNLSTGGVALVAVSVQRTLKTGLTQFLGPSTSIVYASATAALIGSIPDCLTVLSPAGNGALSISNNATVSLHDCGITVDSGDPQALTVSNNAIVQAAAIQVVGGDSIGNGASVLPNPTLNAPPAGDPFASVPAPAYSRPPCFQNTVVTNNSSAVLGPGVYCGGITVSNNASVTFTPGLYVLLGGGLSISNNGTATGTGVTFYNTFDATHPFAPVTFGNNVSATLSATASGSLQGILFFEDRNAPAGYTESFANNSGQSITGVLYFPRSQVSLSNNGSIGHRNLAIVANTVQISNNASLTVTVDLSEAGAPVELGIALVK
jgi:Putative Flp pilus-assembly TadE/G-like